MEDRIFNSIVSFMMKNNYPPTIIEIVEESGVNNKSTIQECLETLEMDGRLTWRHGKSRTIQIPGMVYVYKG